MLIGHEMGAITTEPLRPNQVWRQLPNPSPTIAQTSIALGNSIAINQPAELSSIGLAPKEALGLWLMPQIHNKHTGSMQLLFEGL